MKPHDGLDHDSPSQERRRSLVFGGNAHCRYVGQVPGGGFKQAHARNRLPDGHKQAPLALAVTKRSYQALCAVLKVTSRQGAGFPGGQRQGHRPRVVPLVVNAFNAHVLGVRPGVHKA